MPTKPKPPLIVIVGPTAVGKTELSLKLAREFDGVIISSDSRQAYRSMDIGTAKPSPAELQMVPHRLIDILSPDQELSLAEFQALAYDEINACHAEVKLPLLVGGTGQYVKAVIEGWGIPEVPPHPRLRADLEAFAEMYGSTILHHWLGQLDPQAALNIDWRNVRRVVRAVEVCLIANQPITKLQERNPPPYRILTIGLTRPRHELYQRVDLRIDQMIANGFVVEVEELLARGYSWALPSMSSLGYPEIGAYLRGEITLEEASTTIKQETRRFIRHQYNWFQPDDPSIRWFDLSQTSADHIQKVVQRWLSEQEG